MIEAAELMRLIRYYDFSIFPDNELSVLNKTQEMKGEIFTVLSNSDHQTEKFGSELEGHSSPAPAGLPAPTALLASALIAQARGESHLPRPAHQRTARELAEAAFIHLETSLGDEGIDRCSLDYI